MTAADYASNLNAMLNEEDVFTAYSIILAIFELTDRELRDWLSVEPVIDDDKWRNLFHTAVRDRVRLSSIVSPDWLRVELVKQSWRVLEPIHQRSTACFPFGYSSLRHTPRADWVRCCLYRGSVAR